ncbi:MAG: NUDIX hydrolase [Thermoanaerobaculia bacterium]
MLKPWVVEESRITYEDQWLKVRTDRCISQSGRVIDPFHVLEYPAWVNVVALTADGEIVLVRQYRHGVGQILLEIPAGIVDPKDTPASAALRELREETGYAAEQLHLTGSMDANPATQTNRSWSFLATGATRVGQQRLDDTEDIEVSIEPFVAFADRVIRGETNLQGLHLAGVHCAIWHILRSTDASLDGMRAELRDLVLRYLSAR